MIKLVYQDCPMCGSREKWGKAQLEAAKAAGIEFEAISFATPEGQHLCKEAILAGVGNLPFYTDGKVFRQSITDFIKPEKPAKKRATKRKKEA